MSVIDELLRHPHLWRAREHDAAVQTPGLSTGQPALDRCLPGGGWPRHGLIEVLTDRHGIGELSLLAPALASLCRPSAHETSSDGWLAWIAPPYQPYAPALADVGIDVSRVLVVRAAPAAWAMEQALRSAACSAVLGWVDVREQQELRRLQLAAEQNRCFTVLFRSLRDAATTSPAVLRLALTTTPAGLVAQVLKSRGGSPQRVLLGPCIAARVAAWHAPVH
jgi:hypothetical protein